MALIKCNECGNDVSSNAASCPRCGNPIAVAGEIKATGVPVTTTQATAKKFKGHMLLAVALCCVGVVMLVSGDGGMSIFGALVFLAGLIWYFVARAQSWWQHG